MAHHLFTRLRDDSGKIEKPSRRLHPADGVADAAMPPALGPTESLPGGLQAAPPAAMQRSIDAPPRIAGGLNAFMSRFHIG